eukprot:3465087-Pyramimonas_sp.AAC.1
MWIWALKPIGFRTAEWIRELGPSPRATGVRHRARGKPDCRVPTRGPLQVRPPRADPRRAGCAAAQERRAGRGGGKKGWRKRRRWREEKGGGARGGMGEEGGWGRRGEDELEEEEELGRGSVSSPRRMAARRVSNQRWLGCEAKRSTHLYRVSGHAPTIQNRSAQQEAVSAGSKPQQTY